MPPRIVFQHLRKTGGTTIRDLLLPFFCRDNAVACGDTFDGVKTIDMAFTGIFDKDLVHGHAEMISSAPSDSFKFAVFREPFSRLLSERRQWMQASERDIAEMDETRAAATTALQHKSLESIIDCLSDYPIMLSSFWNHQATTLGAWPIVRKTSSFRQSNDYKFDALHKHFPPPQNLRQWLEEERPAILRHALQALRSLDYVGIYEDFEVSVKEIFDRLGLPRPPVIPVINARQAYDDESDPTLFEKAKGLLELDAELYEAAKERHSMLERIARGPVSDYIGRFVTSDRVHRFSADTPPGGHGWKTANLRSDGEWARWTEGFGESIFTASCDKGHYIVTIEIWGAVCEAAILGMQLKINNMIDKTEAANAQKGCKSLTAEFIQITKGPLEIALVHNYDAGSQAVEIRSIEFKPADPR